MIWPLWVALALAESDREAGVAAERTAAWPEALAAYERCANTGSDRDRRFCAARQKVLAPHAADGFAGYRALMDVRDRYASIGPAAASARIRAALDANPTGPAADELHAWLLNEGLKAGPGVEEVARLASAHGEGATAREAAWVAERVAGAEVDARHRRYGHAGFAAAGLWLIACLRPQAEPFSPRRALTALGAFGAGPMVVAAAWDTNLLPAFALNAAWVAVSGLVATRAPWPLGAAGCLGGFVGLAWWQGWMRSLGVA